MMIGDGRDDDDADVCVAVCRECLQCARSACEEEEGEEKEDEDGGRTQDQSKT